MLVDANGNSYVSPISQAIARLLYPRANVTDQPTLDTLLGANYVYFRRTINQDDRYTVRIDHDLSGRHHLSSRYTYQPLFGDRYNRDEIDAFVNETTAARNILLTWAWTARANLVNELRAGYVFGNFSRSFSNALQNRDLTTETARHRRRGCGARQSGRLRLGAILRHRRRLADRGEQHGQRHGLRRFGFCRAAKRGQEHRA